MQAAVKLSGSAWNWVGVVSSLLSGSWTTRTACGPGINFELSSEVWQALSANYSNGINELSSRECFYDTKPGQRSEKHVHVHVTTCTHLVVWIMHCTLYIHMHTYIHTVEPAKTTTHVCRPPDLNFSSNCFWDQLWRVFDASCVLTVLFTWVETLKKNASVFLVYKSLWILSFSGRFSLLWPGFVS